MSSADENCKHVANKSKKPRKELGLEPFPRGAGEFDSHALPPVQAIPKGRIRSTSVPQIVDLLIKSYVA